MLRNRFLSLFLLAAFILSGTALFAQAKQDVKQQDKKQQDKKGVELIEPIKQEKPKGPEKLMIYNGEYLKAQLYGFVKFDMVYNTTDVTNESGPFWTANQVTYFTTAGGLALVVPTSDQKFLHLKNTASMRSGSFVMDMRSTRLGLRLTGPKVLMADSMALIEMDFWGTAAATGVGERCGMPMMRHAYTQLTWPSGTTLLIGQTWSLLMAMSAQPLTVAYIPFGQNGNLFNREPQIALGQKVGNDNYNFTIEVAAARAMGGNDGTFTLYPGVNNVEMDDRGTGEASRYPGGRARLTLVLKPIDIVCITLGGSGHYQLEKQPITLAGLSNTAIWGAPLAPAAMVTFYTQRFAKMTRSYSAQAFTKITVSLVTVVGTYWRGNNMDTFACGLGAGAVENYSGTKVLGVPEQGGYAQIQFDLRKVGPIPLAFSAGYGGILKSNKRFVYTGTILWNEAILANGFWYLNDYLVLGFEFGRHQTKWKGALGSAVDYKYHTGVYFNF
jgi:hypothetical protein